MKMKYFLNSFQVILNHAFQGLHTAPFYKSGGKEAAQIKNLDKI